MVGSSQAMALPRWLRLLLAGGLALAGVGLLALWWAGRRPEKLQLAITSWPGYEYFYLAEQKDLGLAYHLDLRVHQYSSLQDERRAYENNDVDVIATTVPEAIAICQETPRRCPLLVLVLDESVGADRLLARTAIQRPEQLLNQRVGLEQAVLAEYLLLRSFGARPPRLNAMKLLYDGPEALVRGLQAGELDAIVTYAPHDLPLQGDPRFHQLFSSRDLPGEVVDVLAVDPEFARQHPGRIQALVRTWWAAQALTRRDPSQAQALMARRQQIDARSFRQSEQELRYPGPAQQRGLLAADGPLARSMVRMVRLMEEAGRIRPDAPRPPLSRDFLEGR